MIGLLGVSLEAWGRCAALKWRPNGARAKPLGGSGDEPSALTPTATDGISADSASQARLPPLSHTLTAKTPVNVKTASRVGFSELLGRTWMAGRSE